MTSLRILANDGIDNAGRELLEKAGFEIITEKISQDNLANEIGNFDVILVRSATKVTKAVIDGGGEKLKLICRAGVGIDNIDSKYAGEKHIPVFNTPAASSRSVAELVFAHLFSMIRFLPLTNRKMAIDGKNQFNDLKKTASNGMELQGKVLGIIGFGRIGQEVARMAICLGMEVMIYDYKKRTFELVISFNRKYGFHSFKLDLVPSTKEDLIAKSDFISINASSNNQVIMGDSELSAMKKGAGLINCSRGGLVDEQSLVKHLKSGHIAFAGIDVFEKEPPEFEEILTLSNVSLSPHIGASTKEAQARVGIEMAEKIIRYFNK